MSHIYLTSAEEQMQWEPIELSHWHSTEHQQTDDPSNNQLNSLPDYPVDYQYTQKTTQVRAHNLILVFNLWSYSGTLIYYSLRSHNGTLMY